LPTSLNLSIYFIGARAGCQKIPPDLFFITEEQHGCLKETAEAQGKVKSRSLKGGHLKKKKHPSASNGHFETRHVMLLCVPMATVFPLTS